MKLLAVRNVVQISPGHFDCLIDVEWGPNERQSDLQFHVHPDDPHGLGPAVRARIEAGAVEGRILKT